MSLTLRGTQHSQVLWVRQSGIPGLGCICLRSNMCFCVLCACAGMLHPGEVGPSEEFLRFKATVETLEKKLQTAVDEGEDWRTRFQSMHQAKVNLDSELAQSVEACKRIEKQLQAMVPIRSVARTCRLSIPSRTVSMRQGALRMSDAGLSKSCGCAVSSRHSKITSPC